MPLGYQASGDNAQNGTLEKWKEEGLDGRGTSAPMGFLRV